jgi:Tol biopolymer transport system component/DNA-binding winged helix-turn-helix (wHTH) protein
MQDPNINTEQPDQRQRDALRIGDWELHPDLAVLRGAGGEVRLLPKALAVLLVLTDQPNKGVSRETLLNRVWGSSYPSDEVVSRAIADLRLAFGEKAGDQRYIRTLPKYGYQLVAETGPLTQVAGAASTKGVRQALVAVLITLVAVLVGLATVDWFASEDANLWTGFRPLTSAPGLERQPRLSPDGRWVIYAALKPERSDWDLFRVELESGETQPVAASADAFEHGPAFSPRGDEVAYVRFSPDRCEVMIQAIALGVPRPVARCARKFPTLVDWSGDGQWLALTNAVDDDPEGRRRIYRLNLASGDLQAASGAVSATGTDFYPRFSPDASQIAFLRGEPHPDHRATLWVVNLEDGQEQALTRLPEPVGGMTWINDQELLFSVQIAGRMVGRRVSIDSPNPQPIPLDDVLHPEFDASHQTLIAARQRRDKDLAVLEPDGSVHAVARSTFDEQDGQFSPDGQWLTFVSRRSGYEELWIASVSGESSRQLTRFEGANVRHPVWRPDGQAILFTAEGAEQERMYLVDVVGGQLELLPTPFDQVSTPQWHSDGVLVFGCRDNEFRGICSARGEQIQHLAEGFHRPQPITSEQVLVSDDLGHLHALDIVDGQTRLVWSGLPGKGRIGWAVSGKELLFVTGGERGESGQLMRRNLASGETQTLYQGHMPVVDVRLHTNSVTGAVLFTRYQASSDDIVVYRNIRFD